MAVAVRLFSGVDEMPDQVSAVYPLPSQEKGQADASGHYRVGSCRRADSELLGSAISPAGLLSVNFGLHCKPNGVSVCVTLCQRDTVGKVGFCCD